MSKGKGKGGGSPAPAEQQQEAPSAAVIAETVESGGATADGSAPAGETQAPPATEDHVTAFERRCERLIAIAEEAEFESGTLVGDLRDGLLDIFKHRPKPWSQMSNAEQKDVARALEAVAQMFIRKTVLVMAQEDSHTVEGTLLSQFTVKGDAIEAKIKIESVDSEGVIDVYRLAGHKIVIVSADDKRFRGQRGDVTTEPDQRPLEFESGGAKALEPAPSHPADDSDLAGRVDELFRVAAVEDDETLYLTADEPAQWTDALAEGGSWPREEADKLAAEHDATVVYSDGAALAAVVDRAGDGDAEDESE